jgi:sorting nexin-1/2
MSLEEASSFIDTPSAPAAPYTNAISTVSSAIPSPSSEHADDHQPVDGVLGTGRVEVSVSDPTKVGDGMSAYTVFKVTTKIMSASARIFVVQRRYSDFEWLQSQLSHDFPGIIIPPLPEKSFIGRFSSDFVEARQRGLEKFMLRILNHKLLSKCKDLPTFVMANEQVHHVACQYFRFQIWHH